MIIFLFCEHSSFSAITFSLEIFWTFWFEQTGPQSLMFELKGVSTRWLLISRFASMSHPQNTKLTPNSAPKKGKKGTVQSFSQTESSNFYPKVWKFRISDLSESCFLKANTAIGVLFLLCFIQYLVNQSTWDMLSRFPRYLSIKKMRVS